eukprot:3421583-Pleurochrysis_carterae.AAC.1
MLVMHRRRQRLGEDVGHVIIGMNLVHLNAPVSDVLSHFQVASIDMPRTLARAPVLGQLDGAR